MRLGNTIMLLTIPSCDDYEVSMPHTIHMISILCHKFSCSLNLSRRLIAAMYVFIFFKWMLLTKKYGRRYLPIHVSAN